MGWSDRMEKVMYVAFFVFFMCEAQTYYYEEQEGQTHQN